MNQGLEPRRLRLGQRLGLIAFGVLLPLVVAEVALQCAALFYSTRGRGASEAAAREHRVLCVGDSYTYGIGSSSPDASYPGHLQRLLDERDPGRWFVINEGWPGRNSALLGQAVPGLIEEYDPTHMVLLIGTNNSWNRDGYDVPVPSPDEDLGVADEDRFVLRFRTGRLLQVFWRGSTEARRSRPEDRSAGGTSARGVPETLAAALEGKSFEPGSPARNRKVPAGLDSADEETWRTLWEVSDASGEGTRASTMLGDLPFEASLRPDVVDVVSLHLELLDRLFLHDPCVELGRRAVERYGPSPEISLWTVRSLARMGHREEAAHEARVLERELPDQPATWIRIAPLHWVNRDLTAFLQARVRAFVLSGSVPLMQKACDKVREGGSMSRDAYVAALDGIREEVGDFRQGLIDLYDEGAVGEEPVAGESTRLQQDVEFLIAYARRRGVTPIVHSYPRPRSEVDPILRGAAKGQGVPFVDHHPRFRELVAASSKEDWFVADGHCNDAGYGIMAENLADQLLAETVPE